MSPEIKRALSEIDKAREILNRYSHSWVLAFDIEDDDLKNHTSFMWQEGNSNTVTGLMLRTLISFGSEMIRLPARLDEEEED
jgi:hypothetical protein